MGGGRQPYTSSLRLAKATFAVVVRWLRGGAICCVEPGVTIPPKGPAMQSVFHFTIHVHVITIHQVESRQQTPGSAACVGTFMRPSEGRRMASGGQCGSTSVRSLICKVNRSW